MYQLRATVRSNASSAGYGHCVLEAPEIARAARPGQCVNVRITDGVDPLLRRPFGIHRVEANAVALMYAVVGRGTRLLSQAQPGDALDIVGPFGHGFEFGGGKADTRAHLLVAGGIGAAPLVFLAERLAREKTGGRLIALVGAKTKSHIICEKEFKRAGCDVRVATDDGSRGKKGRVTEVLASMLCAGSAGRIAAVYACGPHPMLAAVGRLCGEKGIAAQVSLESHMSCGIGACMGCTVKTLSGNKRACKDGPVFDAGEVIWE